MILVENLGSEIYVFGRKGREPYVEKVLDFKPYFYAEDSNGEFATIDGKKVKKIFVNDPGEVPEIRTGYNHYEADIPFVTRFIVDKFDSIEKEELRKLYIDIEIEVLDSFPDVQKAINKILSIACFDSFTEKNYIFVINLKNIEEIKETEKQIIYFFKDEVSMLKKFISFFQETDPDVLIGWNLDNFDAPYLIKRLSNLKLDPNSLSRLQKTYITKDGVPRIFGRILFDLMYGYKKIAQGERESFSLEYISQYELGEGKEKYEGEIKDLYGKFFDKFISYNIRDVELLIMLDKKLKLTEFFDEIRRYAKCKFEDVFMSSKVIDALLLSFCKGRFVLPSKKKNMDPPIEGALVLQPVKGIYENIVCVDLKSLYPSLLCQFNMSLETLSKDGSVKLGNGISFDEKIKGILVEIVERLFLERQKYRGEMKKYAYGSIEYKAYDMLQYAVKVILNSVYGVIGYGNFRLFKREIAQSITWAGRAIITWSKDVVEKQEYKVIYSDTDSLFIQGKSAEMSTLVDEGKFLAKILNDSFVDFVQQFGCDKNNYLEMQFEKIFSTMFFSGVKKRYCGKLVWKDGKEVKDLVVVGFEQKRSDTPRIGREFQKQIFDMVLNKKSRQEVEAYVEDFKNKIKKGFTADEIGIPTGISKHLSNYKYTPIHIRAVINANKHHNAHFAGGDKVKYVYVKKVPQGIPFDNVIAFKNKLWDGYEIDEKEMIRRIVDLKVEPIYEALGWEKKLNKSLLDF